VIELGNWKFVPVKEMPAPVVVDKAPLKIEVPLPADWIIDPAEMAAVVMLLALEKVTVVNGVAPMAPVVIFPVPAASVNALAPVTVANVMFPMPVPLFNVVAPVNVIGLVKAMG